MDSSNHWYGHAHILARYCGLDDADPPPIKGVLQHGWTFVHGFGYGHRPPLGYARFAWSDVCRRRGQAIGWREYYIIGAPFGYLMAMEPPDPNAPEPEGTIWYPFHGTVDFEGVSGDHSDLIAEIKDTEPGPVTMCLYYVEYEQPAIRQEYEDAGFRVICHGRRGTKWAGTTSNFLHNQLRELRRHKRVCSNRLSTATFYGMAAGLEAGIYGDPMELVDVKDGFNGQRLLEHTFPELHTAHVDIERGRELARQELGLDQLLDPTELKLILGWQDNG